MLFLKHETLIHSYMKLKHEQYCNATWIESELKFYLIELNSNTLNLLIPIQLNSLLIQWNLIWKLDWDSIELNSNSIEEKYNANWWR
jgi:hypothetical protein